MIPGPESEYEEGYDSEDDDVPKPDPEAFPYDPEQPEED